MIKDQKLDCQGDLRSKRFGNPGEKMDGKPWDGIHLRGRLGSRHFTNSMANIFAASFPGIQINWSANQSGDSFSHNTCAQANYQRRHFTTSRTNRRNNGNYSQPNYQGSNTANGFSQQGGAVQSRGFKRNNQNGNNFQGQGVNGNGRYNIPVSNRFQEWNGNGRYNIPVSNRFQGNF